MEEAAKETVIVVHGTYAAPQPGARLWYQPVEGVPATEGFIAKLNDALQKRGSAARCWAHCSQGNQGFHWSGSNNWIDRTQAASELGSYVRDLRNKGWCCHIVAHSHGGNVVVEALPQITTALRSDAPLGKIVTLGTPFMDTRSPILQRITSDRRGFTRNAWLSLIFVMLIMVLLAASSWLANFTSKALGFAVAAAVVAAVILFVFFGGKSHTAKAIAQMQPKFLAIGSRMDEPWQLLHHMRNASNPMAVQTKLIRYLISSLQSRLSRSQQVDRIYGAKSYRDLKPAAKVFWGTCTSNRCFEYFLCYLGYVEADRLGFVEGDDRTCTLGGHIVVWGLCWFAAGGALYTHIRSRVFFGSCVTLSLVRPPPRCHQGHLRGNCDIHCAQARLVGSSGNCYGTRRLSTPASAH